MPKKTKTTIAILVASTALIAGTGVYGATAAFADARPHMRATAESTTITASTDSTTTQELRAQILDMLKDHMGLTGSQAEEWAASMAQQMHKNGITDASEMLNECNEAGGMMGGSNMMNGTNGSRHESHHQSTTTAAVN